MVLVACFAARAAGVPPATMTSTLSATTRARASALTVMPSSMFISERRHLVALAAKNRLPAVYPLREFVDAGGLMAYGPNLPDLSRRAATYIDISKHAGGVNDESILVRRDCCVTLQCASVVTNEGIPM
ncbi:MAG: hypothetical protein DME00_06980, partial [Candidatus Rokuibacteriota bacterium]